MSLWNILRNNIGKDLSKVSMPVQLNEPLNTLQRLCEELEYSSLLDQASRMADPCERMVPTQGRLFLPRFCLSFCHPGSPLGGSRMLEHYIKTPDFACNRLLSPSPGFFTPVALCLPQVYIAAFAVSAYSSTYHRAGCKPFNPVLGETYECERPDRGFRFISEQVWAQRWEDCSQDWAREGLGCGDQKVGPWSQCMEKNRKQWPQVRDVLSRESSALLRGGREKQK